MTIRDRLYDLMRDIDNDQAALKYHREAIAMIAREVGVDTVDPHRVALAVVQALRDDRAKA